MSYRQRGRADRARESNSVGATVAVYDDPVEAHHAGAAIAANWRSCAGVALVLAPRSSMWVCPCAAGIAEMIAARSTPGRVPSTKCAIAVSAPVLPALTHAQAVPACTRSTATRIEDCFLWRIASRGLSCIYYTCLAGTKVSHDCS